MKKIYALMAAGLMAASASAQDFKQSVELTVPAQSTYDAELVYFDYEAVCEALGLESINPENICRLGDNGEIVLGNFTGNDGYWFDINGDVCFWGDDAAVYAEFWGEDFLAVGQYPDHLKDGDVVNFKFYFTNDGKIAEFDITYNVSEPEVLEGEVVKSSYLLMKTVPDNDYAASYLETDYAAIEEAIGCTLGEAMLVAYVDDELTNNFTGNYNEFWFDKEGNVGYWGDDASIYVGLDADGVYVGQMPYAFEEGGKVNVKFGVFNEGKIALIYLTYQVEVDESSVSSIASDGVKTVYNLQGMKMNAEQLPAGLYIINGKKVIVK